LPPVQNYSEQKITIPLRGSKADVEKLGIQFQEVQNILKHSTETESVVRKLEAKLQEVTRLSDEQHTADAARIKDLEVLLQDHSTKLSVSLQALQESSECLVNARELLAVKNNSIRVSNLKLEEVTAHLERSETKFQVLLKNYQFLERENISTVSSLKEKISNLGRNNSELSHAVTTRNERLSELEARSKALAVEKINLQKQLEEANSKSKAEEKQDVPAAQAAAGFVKRSARNLIKLDWRLLKDLKFSSVQGPAGSLLNFENSIVELVQRNVVFSNDAVAHGLLGNYFSNQIRDHLGLDDVKPKV